MKKSVLVISQSFIGGGLETRINSIVDKYENYYSFSLITQTDAENMKILPSTKFKKIYKWSDLELAIKENQIISFHPFGIIDKINRFPKFHNKIYFYTLHGEASLNENLSEIVKKIDLFYATSDKIIELFKSKYPQFSDKIRLFKNYYQYEIKINLEFINNKNILFSITNNSDWEYYNNLINHIPADYTIKCIGHTPKNKYDRENIIYDGFVDTKQYLGEQNFCLAISRGGFATMDIIANGIPSLQIYNRFDKKYLELITRDNFFTLSNHNFVTWTECKDYDFKKIIELITLNRQNYICADLLKKYNSIDLMPKPYVIESCKIERKRLMVKSNKLVSIILPTYNGSKFIRESIDSIINQTYKNWELIIVNDCSTDNTLDIVNNYAKQDERIRIISNPINMKLPKSLNIGFENAKGEYYTWTSDDNIYHLSAIEYMVDFLDNNSSYDLIGCDYELIEENGNFIQLHSELYPHEFLSLLRNAVVGACFLYTKSIAEKVGKYAEDMFCAEDYDYWCRLAQIGKIYFSDEVLYKYRFNSQSLSSTKTDFITKQVVKIQKKYACSILNKSNVTMQQKRQILLKLNLNCIDRRWLIVALKYGILTFLYILIMTAILSLNKDILLLKQIKKLKNTKIAFWGASLFLEKLIKKYHIRNQNIVGIIDKDSDKWGKELCNYTIYSPEQIKKLDIEAIIFTIKNNHNRVYPQVKKYIETFYPDIKLVPNFFFD